MTRYITTERVGTPLCITMAATLLSVIVGCATSAHSLKKPLYFGTPAFPAAVGSEHGAASKRPVRLASLREELRDVPLGDRIVVYSAAYRIVVKNVEGALEEAERVADKYNGYVKRIDGSEITIRVQVHHYEQAIAAVEALGQVTHRQQEAADVTDQYVDLEARLRNAKAVRARLEALLARAETVSAALEVEKELKRLGEEIETLEARLELLKHRVAFSTIRVDFERVARKGQIPAGAKQLPFPWLRELDPNRLWAR